MYWQVFLFTVCAVGVIATMWFERCDSTRFSPKFSAVRFIVMAALFNGLFYQWPVFSFARQSLGSSQFGVALTLLTLFVVVFSAAILLLGLVALLSYRLLKPVCMLIAVANALALYFVVTYNVVLDRAMMGNVLNTRLAESAELWHVSIVGYLVVFGLLPGLLISRVRISPSRRWRVLVLGIGSLTALIVWAYMASSTWGWIDKHAKRLGGTIMPWSYILNTGRAAALKWQVPVDEQLLPSTSATGAASNSGSNQKKVVVLVIGESARAANFEFYGYPRSTNPRLAERGVVALKNTRACSTYTTESLRCILSHQGSERDRSVQYEPLPSYLQRQGVDVIWRSRNWGEPDMKVGVYQKAADLMASCAGAGCEYDELLLAGLEEQIKASPSNNVLVVLHQSGSHGPAYSTKYPAEFSVFKPVCQSVELGRCSSEELFNAYDNTILYTDFFLSQAIDLLKRQENTTTAMMYISDHGESLGEYRLYLHGTPWSFAPDVQKDVPFLLWMSELFIRELSVRVGSINQQQRHSHNDVFHSIMGAFGLRSDIYQPGRDLFNPAFGQGVGSGTGGEALSQ